MIDIILIAAVQIIVESLPISSTGHVALVQLLWTKVTGYAVSQVPDFFDHFLHGPTVIVVLTVFYKRWFFSGRRLVTAWLQVLMFRRPLCWSERRLSGVFLKIFGFMCAADVVTVIAYGIKSFIGKEAGIFCDPRFMFCNMAVTMVALLSLRWVSRNNRQPLTVGRSCIIGSAQGLALLFTGLSRFGATYVIGCWLGLRPRRAFQFSFLIQFPLILAAFVCNGVPSMIKTSSGRALLSMNMLVVCSLATVIAGLAFAWVYRCALRRQLWWFGVYMAIPITALLLLIIR